MKTLRAVLIVSSAVCVLGIVQAHSDPVEPSANASGETKTDATGWELPKLPHVKPDAGRDWFPDSARRMGMEGRVLLGFDLTAQGRAKNVSVIWSENRVFESSAVEMLKAAHFSVGSDWTQTGAWRRWRLGFVYRLSPSCQSDEFAIPVETVVITGSRLPGAPGRPGSGNSSGSCAPSSPH